MNLAQKVAKQIEFANKKTVQCESDGDEAGVDSWRGYVSALRWVEEQLKREYVPLPPAPRPQKLAGTTQWQHKKKGFQNPPPGLMP